MNANRFPCLIAALLAILLPLAAHAADQAKTVSRAIIVLDASGSMWGEIDGKPKIEIARSVIAGLVQNWDPKIELGLMAYGHRRKADCDDIELLIPPGPVDPAEFLRAVNALSPKGKTPITASVVQAAEALRYTEERATVILVSDGVETCGMDPCAAAERLASRGVDFKAHVVGFDLTKEDQAAIDCLAKKTGGLFLAARDASSLKKALAVAVKKTAEPPKPTPKPKPTPTPATPTPAPTPAPATPTPPPAAGPGQLMIRALLAEGGEAVEAYAYVREPKKDLQGRRKDVRSSGTRSPIRLEPGRYHVTVTWGTASAEKEIEMPAGGRVEETFILDAGLLRLQTLAEKGGETVEAYYTIRSGKMNLRGQRETITSGGGAGEFRLGAGKYLVEAKWGTATKEEEVEIRANEATDVTVLLGAGIVNILPLATEGGEKVEAFNRVYEAKKNLAGQRRELASSAQNAFRLSAGEYVVTSTWGAATGEAAVTVRPGEATDIPVILNAGVLRLQTKDAAGQAVGGIFYTVFHAKESLAGRRETVTGGGASEFRLPAGRYIVEAKRGNRKTETEVEVKAGSRADATLAIEE